MEKTGGPEGKLFKRHEHFREFAREVLGVDITLTPASDATIIRASTKTGFGDVATRSIHVSRLEIDNCNLDILGLNMIQAVKDVGGFSVLH